MYQPKKLNKPKGATHFCGYTGIFRRVSQKEPKFTDYYDEIESKWKESDMLASKLSSFTYEKLQCQNI